MEDSSHFCISSDQLSLPEQENRLAAHIKTPLVSDNNPSFLPLFIRNLEEIFKASGCFSLRNHLSGAHGSKNNAAIEVKELLSNGVEVGKSYTDKHIDLLRPAARSYSAVKGQAPDAAERDKGKYTLLRDPEDFQFGSFDKPLPCYGCGIGWFSDPRERAGLAAAAIAAMTCSVVLIIVLACYLLF